MKQPTTEGHILAQLRDPRLAPHLASAVPAWLWAADGSRVLWACVRRGRARAAVRGSRSAALPGRRPGTSKGIDGMTSIERRSPQFGRASAPTMPPAVHTTRSPNTGTGTSSPSASTFEHRVATTREAVDEREPHAVLPYVPMRHRPRGDSGCHAASSSISVGSSPGCVNARKDIEIECETFDPWQSSPGEGRRITVKEGVYSASRIHHSANWSIAALCYGSVTFSARARQSSAFCR